MRPRRSAILLLAAILGSVPSAAFAPDLTAQADPRAGEQIRAIAANPAVQEAFRRIEALDPWGMERLLELTQIPAPPFGEAARGARYRKNCDTLIDGMASLGLRTFLPRAVQAPIIVTFHAPPDPAYAFKPFYEKVKARGYLLYPGKLTQVETFRVGCIGAIDANEMRNVVAAVAETLKDMGVKQVISSRRWPCG